MAKDYVVVIGGLNVDISGLAKDNYLERDSNIGKIELNIGGVGHNIAVNLAKLDVPTHLITVYSDDYFGSIAKKETLESGIYLDYAEEIPGERSSTFLYVADHLGDMVTAINDMGIIDHMTPEFLKKRIDFINGAKLVVLDANLSQASIDWLGEHCSVPIFADPVSVVKAGRFANILDKIDTIKPNDYEAEALTGIKIVDEETAGQAAKAIVDKGVKNVFISLGAKGMVGSDQGNYVLTSPIPGDIVSTNGSGDCTMATIAWARYQYGDTLSVQEVTYFTQAAARITVSSNQAVSPDLSVRNIINLAASHYTA